MLFPSTIVCFMHAFVRCLLCCIIEFGRRFTPSCHIMENTYTPKQILHIEDELFELRGVCVK